MAHYIDKDTLVAEIDRRITQFCSEKSKEDASVSDKLSLGGRIAALEEFKVFINTLEMKEVDLGKLGEIARHLIAVKENIEDMRLDKKEWLVLEKIGYPERFKAQKGE